MKKKSEPEIVEKVEEKLLPKLGLSDMLSSFDEPKTDMDKIVEMLLDPKNIAFNTDLSKNEITAFSVLATMEGHPTHPLPVLDAFLKKNLILRVSRGRKGRAEWVKMLSRSMGLENQEDQMQMSRWGRLMGRR